MLGVREILNKLIRNSIDDEELVYCLKGEHSGNSNLLRLCRLLESTYYTDIRSFSTAKASLVKIAQHNIFDEFDKGCLNCYLMVNKDSAKRFFSSRLLEIEAGWLSLLLGTSIGRDVELALGAYERNRNELTSAQKNVYKRYLICDKIGIRFTELRNSKFEYDCRNRSKFHFPPLKVAVCVSGQLRGFEEANKSLESLLRGHNVDYFVHVWNDVGSVKKESFKNKRIHPPYLANFLADLEAKRPDIYRKIYSYIFNEGATANKDILTSVYGREARVELEDDCLTMSNSEKMHYKIKACFDLIENPCEYDLVVRARPDLVVKEKLKIDWQAVHHAALEGAILACYGYTYTYYGLGVDDKIAIASPERMQLYANFWKERTRFFPVVGHASLAQYLFDNEVDVIGLDSVLEVCANDTKSVDEGFIRMITDI